MTVTVNVLLLTLPVVQTVHGGYITLTQQLQLLLLMEKADRDWLIEADRGGFVSFSLFFLSLKTNKNFLRFVLSEYLRLKGKRKTDYELLGGWGSSPFSLDTRDFNFQGEERFVEEERKTEYRLLLGSSLSLDTWDFKEKNGLSKGREKQIKGFV